MLEGGLNQNPLLSHAHLSRPDFAFLPVITYKNLEEVSGVRDRFGVMRVEPWVSIRFCVIALSARWRLCAMSRRTASRERLSMRLLVWLHADGTPSRAGTAPDLKSLCLSSLTMQQHGGIESSISLKPGYSVKRGNSPNDNFVNQHISPEQLAIDRG